ncbi:uncharacterized protein METZ01_LOCUS379427 [marine metagenome]|uniref:Uncharacterized protein n=1 Tax=marine metagenome TaxID=408172 RepID=A0A382TX51_9ZZZZ
MANRTKDVSLAALIFDSVIKSEGHSWRTCTRANRYGHFSPQTRQPTI